MRAQPDVDFEKDIKLIEASMSLAAFGANRADGRRAFEWKMSFAVWALIAAAIIHGFVAFPLVAIVFLFLYGRWLQNVWMRHATDAELMWNFANEAQRLIAKHGVVAVPKKPHLRIGRGRESDGWRGFIGFIFDWSLGFQFFITAGLLALVYATADRVTWFEMVLKPSASEIQAPPTAGGRS